MILSASAPTIAATTATAVSVAAAEAIDGPWGLIVTVAAVLTASVVIGKTFHVREIVTGVRDFLRTWNGEPARPGFDRRPGLAENMQTLQDHVHEIKGRDTQLAEALEELARSAQENGSKIDRLDKRVTDHRRRNEQTIELLQDAVRQQAEDRMVVDAARAVLTELGHDGELPSRGTDDGGTDRKPLV